MAILALTLSRSLASRYSPRRAGMRSRAGGGRTRPLIGAALLAAVLSVALSAPARPRLDGTSSDWSDAWAVQRLPSLYAFAVHRADPEFRVSRRPWPRVEVPVAAGAKVNFASWLAPTSNVPAPRRGAIAEIDARGYDANAPPIS